MQSLNQLASGMELYIRKYIIPASSQLSTPGVKLSEVATYSQVKKKKTSTNPWVRLYR